jgi:hypothetical protein
MVYITGLFMLPHKHLAISIAVGAAAWWHLQTPAAMGAALVGGVLPDLDHAVDYAYYHWRGKHRLILPLHGYEYAVIAGLVALLRKEPLLGVAAAAYLIHLFADQAENRTKVLGYSVLYRAYQRFQLERISTVPEDAARGREDDFQMLARLFKRLGLLRQ